MPAPGITSEGSDLTKPALARLACRMWNCSLSWSRILRAAWVEESLLGKKEVKATVTSVIQINHIVEPLLCLRSHH